MMKRGLVLALAGIAGLLACGDGRPAARPASPGSIAAARRAEAALPA